MRNSVSDLMKMYRAGEKISCVTAYDSSFALLADRAGVDLLLVGDSMGMTVLGYENTIPVSLDDIANAASSVMRASQKAFVVADLPFMSANISEAQSLANATRLMQESKVSAVKLEGGVEVAPLVAKMVGGGIPVMGHIGLLPQGVLVEGGYKVKGRKEEEAKKLMDDALALQAAGAFSIVMECITENIAQEITEKLDIPTIGIGSGNDCDGQVQVMHDVLGLDPRFTPRHAKKFLNLASLVEGAFKSYSQEVKAQSFPSSENSYK